jgi:hypothetical protein
MGLDVEKAYCANAITTAGADGRDIAGLSSVRSK